MLVLTRKPKQQIYIGDNIIINIAEVQDAGWNAIADELRRQYGADWRGAYFRD